MNKTEMAVIDALDSVLASFAYKPGGGPVWYEKVRIARAAIASQPDRGEVMAQIDRDFFDHEGPQAFG